jgi:hypothetical protein
VEWRGIQNIESAGEFSFEAILYENGDVLVQHQSLPSVYSVSVGLENSAGDVGLQYHVGFGGLTAPSAIRFYYPTAPAAGLLIDNAQAGAFTRRGAEHTFPLVISNPGRMGIDTYDFEPSSGPWQVTYSASDGITPLTDTDEDLLLDTGPIPAGESATLLVKIRAPANARAGSSHRQDLRFISSLDSSVARSVSLAVSVPAEFASVFQDPTDGAMSFFTASAAGKDTFKATADGYFGYNVALTQISNGNYLYAWDKDHAAIGTWVSDIEYALFDREGNLVLSPTKLTDHSNSTMYTRDTDASVAAAPDGTLGLVWSRFLVDSDIRQYNYNIYFATLNAAGEPQTGPTSLTNNAIWVDWGSSDVVRFSHPSIAATGDNRFIVGWEDSRPEGATIRYTVRDTAGSSVLPPKILTSMGSWSPRFNSLRGGKVIVTWMAAWGGPFYAVIDSSGRIVKPATYYSADPTHRPADAVQLANGKVALAWGTGSGVEFSILNAAYNVESGPHAADSRSFFDPLPTTGFSVTTDTSSHVIMTWMEEINYHKQFYALADSAGTFLTLPMMYRESDKRVEVSWNGQGNAPYKGGSPVDVTIAGAPVGIHPTLPGESQRVSYPEVNNGPVKIESRDAIPFLAAERVVYKTAGGVGTSFTEMMGLPNSQLDTIYWLPWYNNATAELDTQLRFANVSGSTATVHITIGGVEMEGSPFTLGPGTSTRKSFPGISAGPVKIKSDVNIVAAERVVYKAAGVNTSFSEMMALPNSQLDTTYWLPWYNNKDFDTQLRFANVSDVIATVHMYIGGEEMPGSPFKLAPGASTRQSFSGVNNGPVKIESDVNIIAAERVVYKAAGNLGTSFSEMMAFANKQLDTMYWLPWYNNKDFDTQLRFANVSDTIATVHVYIGGAEMTGSPFTLDPGTSTRQSFSGVNNGPVQIVSDVPIVAAQRVVYKVNGVPASFSEMMGLPDTLLDTTYWLPWYNNATAELDTQLRFGVP